MITVELLKKIYPQVTHPEHFVDDLNTCFAKYEINTPSRQAMFLAQCLHESGGFRYTKEIWGPTIWQRKYEGNQGLGNIQPGDGQLFQGRGLIQVTGRNNYTKLASWADNPEILTNPELLETKYAVLSAIWFWTVNKLNKCADHDDIEACTRVVNGRAMLGLDERTRYYLTAKALLNNA